MSHSLDAARKTVAVGPNGQASPAANSDPRCSISREQRPYSGDGEVDETDKAAIIVGERERRVITLNGFVPERGSTVYPDSVVPRVMSRIKATNGHQILSLTVITSPTCRPTAG
jgi:hypothetical protein